MLTFKPSVQFVHIDTDFLSPNTLLLNFVYSSDFQISLNDLPLVIPNSNSASLSKQQGTTLPSHVITDVRHKAKQ